MAKIPSFALAIAIGAMATSHVVVAQNGDLQTVDDAVTYSSTALAAQMETEIAPIISDSTTVEDYEAALAFAISQQSYPEDIVNAALDIVSAAHPDNAPLQQAIDNLRKAAGEQPGTGAIASGSNFGNGSDFLVPAIAIGGGTSNYTN